MESVYSKRLDVISQLRGAKGDLAPYMRPGQTYVNIRHVDVRGLTADQLRCNEIQVVEHNGETFLRATYGHKRDVATRMNYGQYVPYRGHADIFCLTHFSAIGLGEINFSRPMNMLSTPDITQSKGCVGYVSVSQARLGGLEFWSKVGDRYGNKIVCFDPELRDYIYTIRYSPTYGEPESMKKTHAAAIANYSRIMSPEKAFEQVLRLFINEEDYDTEEEEYGIDNDVDDLSTMLEEVVIMA
jgi:hypothetical protein